MAETLRSMTGYGRRETAWAGGMVAAELRAVNHRFCEIVIRLPRSLSSLEEDLKHSIQERCARGRIELTISFMGSKDAGKSLTLDRAVARQYHRLLLDLQQEFRLSGSIDVGLLAGFREIFAIADRLVEEKRLKPIVKRLVRGALADLNTMRLREGAALIEDLRSRIRTVREEIRAVEKRGPVVVQQYFDRMKARVEKLMGSSDSEGGRLHQELAIFADRGDVSEEITRLSSHLDQFEAAFTSREAVGRTLDFLLQEMGREINTIGSKANDAEIAGHVVRVKGELERIREQVQNIE